MNKVKDKLPALVEEELAAAMEEHPLFASDHEGYAVLLEEVEEAQEEMRCLGYYVDGIWEAVKDDDPAGVTHAAGYVWDAAIRLAAEAIQVAAMAKKLMGSLKVVEP